MVLQYLRKTANIEEDSNHMPIIYTHLTLKGLQVGHALTLGWFMLSVARRKISLFASLKNTSKTIKYFTVAGIATSHALGYYKIGKSPENNPKRRILLQNNINQNLIDDMMICGALLGAATSVVLPVKLLGATLIGGMFGTVSFLVNYQILERFNKQFDFKKYL